MTRPYTDADIELVAAATGWDDDTAEVAVDALAAAGRLRPAEPDPATTGRCGQRPSSRLDCALPAGHAGLHRRGGMRWGPACPGDAELPPTER